jgi:hypothetical protein
MMVEWLKNMLEVVVQDQLGDRLWWITLEEQDQELVLCLVEE